MTKKSECKSFPTIIQILILHGPLVDFGRVIQMMFWTLMKNIDGGTGFPFQKQKSLGKSKADTY